MTTADELPSMPHGAERMVLAGRREEMEAATRRVLDRVRVADFSPGSTFAIRLALEEALANALMHGNGGDPGKAIVIEFCIDGEKVIIAVADKGNGFDLAAVPDPTQEENIEIPAGRGIMLMRAYMTAVTYNERGNRVTMRYDRVEPINPRARRVSLP